MINLLLMEMITILDGGTCVRDYIHVQDLAVAHVKALDFLLNNKVKEVFNVGTGKGLSVLDI